MMQPRFLALSAITLILSGCASPASDYPSLAVRDAERVSGTMEVEPAEPYVPAAPAGTTLERVAQLVEEARAAHAEFLSAEPRARNTAAAARSSSVGSESWAVAQVALAELESRRSRTMIALADLDRIYTEVATSGEAIAAVEDERAEIAALVEQENAVIEELLGRIGG